jgi:hypothetical protein
LQRRIELIKSPEIAISLNLFEAGWAGIAQDN